ncbi:MAG TPA: methyltransferase domain-containing protein [Terriglobia bacterium]|nr:methyltransferase domain-containing protein [Terriglobia bacterium]
MNERLSRLLVCPRCKAGLSLDVSEKKGEQIISGSFSCGACAAQYPIKNGIPRFVASEAYTSSFSFEWKRWRRTQFDTASRKSSETAFTASTGARPEDCTGKLVLDAGCGSGRYMDVVARSGAEVVGVDLSLAVEVAQENLGHLPNCHFIQADLFQLPFPSDSFDFFYSIGVLHHTPSTKEAFFHLVRTLKPSGEAAIWVYPRRRLTETFEYFPERVNEVLALDVNFHIPEKRAALVRRMAPLVDWVMETSSSIERFFTTRLPSRWLYGVCHAAVPLYYLYRIPIFFPMRLVTKIAMDPDPEWRVLDTFDWYSPRYQWKHTYPEVRAWFEEAGLEDVAMLPRPVAVRGRKGGA